MFLVSKVRPELFTRGNARNQWPLAYIFSVQMELLRILLKAHKQSEDSSAGERIFIRVFRSLETCLGGLGVCIWWVGEEWM